MKRYGYYAAVILNILLLTACAETLEATQDNAVGENRGETGREHINKDMGNKAFAGEMSIIDTDKVFSERDLRGEYKADKCEKITLYDDGAHSNSTGVEINENTVTINKEGAYVVEGSAKDGMIIVDVDKSEKVQLVLNGVSLTSITSAPIYVKSADKVFITLAEGTENILTNGGSFNAIDDSNIDAVIFSKDDLTLNGTGSLMIASPAGHGIVSKNDLVITNGTYDITAEGHGLSGKDSVAFAGGGFAITAGKDGVHSADDKDDTAGWVYIESGSFDFAAEGDGISAMNEIQIAGGSISITKSYEGLEARLINISGGTIDITASDDGLNAADKRSAAQGEEMQSVNAQGRGGGKKAAHNEANIHISGGIVRVNAEGDGIDSNGHMTVSGGETYVLGSSGGGDGALDYDISATITGGVVVAAGQSNMAVNFGSRSTQGSILVNSAVRQRAGTKIILLDSDGKELLSHTIVKDYNSVVVSCPEIADSRNYTVKLGTEELQVTMDGMIYGEGMFR